SPFRTGSFILELGACQFRFKEKGCNLGIRDMYRPLQRIAQTALPVILLAFTSAHAQVSSAEDWKTFTIPEFGTRVQYPARIFSVLEGRTEKGTGERLMTEDGRASLSLYLRMNESGDTPSSYSRRNLRFAQSDLEYQQL